MRLFITQLFFSPITTKLFMIVFWSYSVQHPSPVYISCHQCLQVPSCLAYLWGRTDIFLLSLCVCVSLSSPFSF